MTFKEKYNSIDQTKLPETAKAYMVDFKKDSNNFTNKEAMAKMMPALDKFIAALKDSGYGEAIKGAAKKETKKKAETPTEMAKEIVEDAIEQPKTKTGKPKVGNISKGDFMKIAKEIRKEGESWNDAMKRAGEIIRKQKEGVKTQAVRQYEKLKKFIAKHPEVYREDIPVRGGGFRKTTLEVDAPRIALPRGKRVSKKGWKNQYGKSEGGKTYYEYRSNRYDTNRKRYPFLADGGDIEKAYTIYIYYGGSRPYEVQYADTLEQARILAQMGEHSEIIDNSTNEMLEFAKGGETDALYTKLLREYETEGYPKMGISFKTFIESKKETAMEKGDYEMYRKLFDVLDAYEGDFYAKGGETTKLEAGVYRVGKPIKVSPILYEQKIVEIFDNGDIATASDYGRKLSDFSTQNYAKTPVISQEILDKQYHFAKGGEMELETINSIADEYDNHIEKYYATATKYWKSQDDKEMILLNQRDLLDHKSVIEQIRKGNLELAYQYWSDMDTASRDNITNDAYNLLRENADSFAKGGKMSYSDIKKEKEKMTTELLKKCGVFFAFSDKQFEENKTPLKEGEKYVSIGGGGYLPKSKVDAFRQGMEAINNYGKEKVKVNDLAENEILFELQNHECFYTGDYSDVVDMFKGTYTEKQIRDVYNKHRHEMEYAKGGSISKSTTYVPNRDVKELMVVLKGELTKLKGKDILDGVYVKNKRKPSPSTESPKELLAFAKKKASSDRNGGKVAFDESDIQLLLDAGLSAEDVKNVLIGYTAPSIQADTEFGKKTYGIINYSDDVQKNFIAEIASKAKKGYFEIGMKYPNDFNWKPIIEKFGISSTPKIVQVDLFRRKTKYEVYLGKGVAIGHQFGFKWNDDKKWSEEEKYGKLDSKNPEFKGGYWGVVTKSVEDMYFIVDTLLKQSAGYLKDLDMFRNGLGGVDIKGVENLKFAKGGEMEDKMSFEEFEETLQEYEIEGGFGKTIEKGYKMYYLPNNNPYLNTKFNHRNKRKAYQEYLKMSKYAKGGKVGFKALSDKVAKYYSNKSVPSKYQSLYGKKYDKSEAKEVGDKVAAKVYRQQLAKKK